MHESSLMKGLLASIEAAAREVSAERVTAVHVTIGALAGISPDHLAQHFQMAAVGTLAAGASLHAVVSDDVCSSDAAHVRLNSIEALEAETTA